MALNLEGNGQTIANVHQPGIFLPGTDKQPLATTRESLQDGNGILIAAVLAPHDTVYAEFGVCWRPAENHQDFSILLFGETMFECKIEIDDWFYLP
jgi:hypothetical protein